MSNSSTKFQIEIDSQHFENALLAAVIAPVYDMGLKPMLQPWADGWLLHVYDKNDQHKTTVGGATLLQCVQKLKDANGG